MLATLTGGTVEIVQFLKDNYFAISLIGMIAGAVWKTGNYLNKYKAELQKTDANLQQTVTDFKNHVNGEFGKLSDRLDQQERAREEGKERTLIIMNAVEATLMTLHAQGANGPVTKSLEELNKYKAEKACK